MKTKILNELLEALILLKKNIADSNEIANENKSLQNLNAYVKLRSLDITSLQNRLSSLGLSSLGRSQSCVINSINQDIFILSRLLHNKYMEILNDEKALTYEEAKSIMIRNSKIFGRVTEEFKTKVMVTLPSEVENLPQLIADLISNGTSVLRINTAHDDANTWNTMAQLIHTENEKQNRNVKIYVDLAGPKNRTGIIKKEFIPFKIGSWRLPRLVEIVPVSTPNALTQKALSKETPATLVVSDNFFAHCQKANLLEIDDFERERKQSYTLLKQDDKLFIIANKKITIYENTKLKIQNKHKGKGKKHHSILYNHQKTSQEIRLFKANQLIISSQEIEGSSNFEYKNKIYAGMISCSNQEIFKHIKIGDDIFIDDGKIGCTIIETNELGVVCQVFLAKENGTLLKEEKGINFPNTDLNIDAITNVDEKNFEDIVGFADMIGISFAQTAHDIEKLQTMLRTKGKTTTAIVPKIETKTALENLPQILIQLLKWDYYALMIARGDLAIEVGFVNLPYIQEEILGICEAGHIPVIYATQILEGKMKNNLPSRAEVTDASLAQRADCVMLNKGPFIVETVIALKSILEQAHQLYQKNRQLLNVCKSWKIPKQESSNKV